MSYLKIIRPVNLLIIILTQVLLRYCVIDTYFGLSLSNPSFSTIDFILLILATVLIAAGGYVINDLFDGESDQINKPDKRIISTAISIKKAHIYYRILTITGITIGFYLAVTIQYWLIGFAFPAVAILLWYYSARYQKSFLIGNLIIAVLSALVILMLWLFEFFALRNDPIQYVDMIGQIGNLHLIVSGYALFAFFVSLTREIIKDNEDIEGDKKQGFKTIAIVYGVKRARNLAVIILISTMLLLAFFQYLLFQAEITLVFWYLMIAVQPLFVFVLYFTSLAKTKAEFHYASNAAKLLMLAGILSMQLFYISF